jgi:hypothetical protein
MLQDCITYLNTKLSTLGYFNEVLCLAEKIERNEQTYPAIHSGKGEYKAINLDPKGSVSYWRKSADVTINEQENSTGSTNVQYETTIPLKLVCFIEKTVYANNQYFSDTLANEIIGYLTTNNSALKSSMKAKKVSVTATSYKTDGRELGVEEYDKIDFEPRYTHAYFSIDFELKIVTNNLCYSDICDSLPTTFGVTIYDSEGVLITTVPCGGTYTETGTDCPGDINIYLDGVLSDTVTTTDYATETVNITLT